MSDNLKIWDQVRRVPSEHLKPFDKGTFKGTAIKPMWFIKTMTELAGPVGAGWEVLKPDFTTERAGDDILVFCTVGVRLFGAAPIYGVGGDYLYRAKSGRSDDEAYKKAYTDALTNALVKLGVGADVHMGLWNGNKYADETVHEKPAAMPAANGTHGASKAANRGTYDKFVQAIRNAPTVKALKDWYSANVNDIDALPADWLDELRVEYSDRLAELHKGLAA